jgi:hypothetical protein
VGLEAKLPRLYNLGLLRVWSPKAITMLTRHEQLIQEAFQNAQNQPGTSEYLSTLLTGPNHSCPHPNKEKSKPVPHRLGFFRQTDDTTTYLDTNKVCQQCYDRAIPQGYNVWSTAYKPAEQPMSDETQRRFEKEGNWAALNLRTARDYYPPMWEAGTEEDPNVFPVNDRAMPSNAEARELWRKLKDVGQPFYVDQLHLTERWNPKAPDQAAEDRRVARENLLAYDNAACGYVGTGVGGAGVNSIVEQRILRDRAQELPATFGYNPDMATHDEEVNMTYVGPTLQRGLEMVGCKT